MPQEPAPSTARSLLCTRESILMGWRGSIRRVFDAAQTAPSGVPKPFRTERPALRTRRQLLADRENAEKLSDRARSAGDALTFANYMLLIRSLHEDAYAPLNWKELVAAPPPSRDDGNYSSKVAEWEWHQRIGPGVLSGTRQAYLKVLDWALPFEELEALGTGVRATSADGRSVEAFAHLRDPELVPRSEPRLEPHGGFRWEKVSTSRYWRLYREHICSTAIRIARELLALLPANTVFVHVARRDRTTSPRRVNIAPIVSVEFKRSALLALDFERLSAAHAIAEFPHNMNFGEATGFSEVELLSPPADAPSA